MKKTNDKTNNSEVRGEQVAGEPMSEAIYLGVDLHKESIMVTRIIDHSTPQPAQRFTWESFWRFAEKQAGLAKKVYAVYEAGAFGFWAARKLQAMKVECLVAHPEKLDPGHKRVQTDKLDSRHLADKLQRYVLGNKRAMTTVYSPSEGEEQQRIESRHRRALSKQLLSLRRRGAGLLLSQGIFETKGWWKEGAWERLQGRLSPQLQEALADSRALMEDLAGRVRTVEKKLEASAPAELPKGFGRLSFVLLLREICNYQRFKTRRNVGGFTGLCGAVSSSGPYHVDLSINKAGSGELRKQLVELAWRMIYWQPEYTGLKVWRQLVQSGKAGHGRRRKIAVVAVARQVAVDLWKWQTGRATAQKLGWEMKAAA
jgi:transposase